MLNVEARTRSQLAKGREVGVAPSRYPGAASAGPVAWVLLLAVLGAALVASLPKVDLSDSGQSHVFSGHRIGDDVRTSFGVVAVEFVRNVDGVTNRALAGASHGVSGLVDSSHVQIQAAVALTNRGDRPLAYSSTQFTLLVTAKGKTTSQVPTGGDLPNMRILPNAGIEGHLDFTVPRVPVRLTLLFRDPGRTAPIVIDLGTTTPTAGAPDSHQHG
ncbi:MAG: hypothetical protein JWM02_690 [Frankiales bacterium]|nr:hypothetical protein [Frankiales bacterium]